MQIGAYQQGSAWVGQVIDTDRPAGQQVLWQGSAETEDDAKTAARNAAADLLTRQQTFTAEDFDPATHAEVTAAAAADAEAADTLERRVRTLPRIRAERDQADAERATLMARIDEIDRLIAQHTDDITHLESYPEVVARVDG